MDGSSFIYGPVAPPAILAAAVIPLKPSVLTLFEVRALREAADEIQLIPRYDVLIENFIVDIVHLHDFPYVLAQLFQFVEVIVAPLFVYEVEAHHCVCHKHTNYMREPGTNESSGGLLTVEDWKGREAKAHCMQIG